MTLDNAPVFSFFKQLVEPCLLLGSLYVIIVANGELFTGNYLLLMIIVFFVSTYVFEQMEIYRNLHGGKTQFFGRDIFAGWTIVVALLALIGYATGLTSAYPTTILLPWVVAAPFILFVNRLFAFKLATNGKAASEARSAVIVGANDAGADLYERITAHPISGIEVRGFFDDREQERQIAASNDRHIGPISDAASYVRRQHIKLIFISMPMAAHPRVLSLLDELKDTTASIYFVPDIRHFELMQARVDDIGGLPILGICESPFTGINSVIKRSSDIVLSALIQLLLAPAMAAIAVGVKLSSPGPIIFSQRRYGLDGEEIMVYKFRSMAVCEDGNTIIQAKKDDPRVTKFGSFLRRTSLDELPQFFNVLQGRMSIVGPRPHAVAHNELYRRQIKGYMLRHKVRPGITGWAQVNGMRGETDTLEKMQSRIEYDLDYLRNWSLLLDLWIIARTVVVVVKRERAY